MAFVDEARIQVISGKGGNGAVSFEPDRRKRRRGRPDGGNGGRGGSVLVEADPNVDSLSYLSEHPRHAAKPGGHGSSKKRAGAEGDDLLLKVPLGTVVKDDQDTVLADLATQGEALTLVKGGRGGRGNRAFLGPKRRLPSFAELGEPAEKRSISLELRTIADVAVIGFPNAGKSSLVGAVSAAKPKVAHYPFTTLEPTIGIVERGDDRFSLCDIPGLVEGAHLGKGLGLKFLRHAQRARVFVHLIDLNSERDPIQDHKIVTAELGRFRPELLELPSVVALNKVDVSDQQRTNSALDAFAAQGMSPLAVSALTGEGLKELVAALFQAIERQTDNGGESYRLYRTDPAETISVTRQGEVWLVQGRSVERWVAMTDMANPEAVAYLQNRLERAGVEAQLEKAGAAHGDDVRIGGVVFEWWPGGSEPAPSETSEAD